MEFNAASIFSDNMVLQRNKRIRIFGTGKDKETVNVSFMGSEYKTAVKDGKWCVSLNPSEAATGQVMILSCGNYKIEFKNIAVGEVFLAGGQSNMEFELQNADGGSEELESNAGSDEVRFYYVQKKAHIDEEFIKTEKECAWECFGSNAKRWSAIAYFFAKKLSKRLGVTVGIIGCNWGGTSAVCWMDSEIIKAHKDISVYYKEYEEGIKGKSEALQRKEYEEYCAYAENWSRKAEECYEIDTHMSWDDIIKRCGECKWPGPVNFLSPFRPSGLYECMIKRVVPYTIAGILYYQGEEDAQRPYLYESLLRHLIENFRRDFKEIDLPVFIVQLPCHRYAAEEDTKSWSYIRQAQENVYKTVKNTGLAVIIDCGEFNEIHPKNKKTPAHRLYLQALQLIYGLADKDEASAPLYKYHENIGSSIKLYFENAGNGFAEEKDAKYFEIAGADKIFYEADAEVHSDYITVQSEKVLEPLYVRYGWFNYFDRFVYAKNGLPLAPFCTYNAEEEAADTKAAKIRQIMEL